jgi:hypothetical protein
VPGGIHATRHAQPAWRPVQLRCYAQDRLADGAEPAAAQPDSRSPVAEWRFRPEQVQQVLRTCKGTGFRIIAAPAGQQPDVFKGMVAMFFGSRMAAHAANNPAVRQSVLPWPPFYDPDAEHRTRPADTFMLSVDGRLEVHSRNVPLSYLILSDQPWSIIVGGADSDVSGQARIPCTEIGFPAHSLVQLNLAKGVLHGFAGHFGAVCAGSPRQAGWSWPWGEGSAAPGWPGPKSVEIDPARMQLVGDRAVPWNVVQEWQNTVALEKSPEAIAYEHARLLSPM